MGSRSTDGYNLTDGGEGLKNPSPEVLKKMQEKKIGNKNAAGHIVSEALKELTRFLNRNRIVTDETRDKMGKSAKGNKRAVGSKSRTGQHFTEEQLENVRKAAQNRPPVTDETREKLSKAGMGHSVSDERRVNMSKAQLGNKKGLGTHRTDDQKKTIGNSIKQAWDRRKQNGPIIVPEETRQKLKEAQKKRREREAKEKQDGD
jgi:hypothetical protein